MELINLTILILFKNNNGKTRLFWLNEILVSITEHFVFLQSYVKSKLFYYLNSKEEISFYYLAVIIAISLSSGMLLKYC